jgi:hypothetical protein
MKIFNQTLEDSVLSKQNDFKKPCGECHNYKQEAQKH